MLHGLMWLPLLAVFIGLAWAGWNEYQKVECYRLWAEGAERAKYDIRSALMQRDGQLIWGAPSRSGILSPHTIALGSIEAIGVQVDGQPIDLDHPPSRGSTVLLELVGGDPTPVSIPFTDIDLAVQWAVALQRDVCQTG